MTPRPVHQSWHRLAIRSLALAAAVVGPVAACSVGTPGAPSSGAAQTTPAGASSATSGSSTPATSAAPTAAGGADACPGLERGPAGLLPAQRVTVKGEERSYVLSVPPEADRATAYPLVFVWHGDGGNGAAIRDRLHLEDAAHGGAIFVYPDGIETPSGWWNFEAHAAKNKDIAFFDALVKQIEAAYCVDSNRIFSTGFSSGGFFTNFLGCERGDRLRAIAPQSGGGPYWPDSAYNDDGRLRCPTPPVAALVIHGNADPVVANHQAADQLEGGWQSFEHWAYWSHDTPRSAYDFATDPTTPDPCVTALDMPQDRPVEACFIDGLGHEPWTAEAETVWEFFASLP